MVKIDFNFEYDLHTQKETIKSKKSDELTRRYVEKSTSKLVKPNQIPKKNTKQTCNKGRLAYFIIFGLD